APLCARSKVQFANHTLRRTFGRTLWLAKTRVETIASILGHEDLRTTVKYLGIKLDDQRDALEKLSYSEGDSEHERF
ncbi:MAG: tyrosine-type recombinase/integrase, partial [Methanomethylophilus sp.]